MAADGSVAPKERVNIVYKPATGDAQEQVELPFRQLVLGDFTLREDSTPLDARVPVSVDKDTFNEVLKAQNLSLKLLVQDKLNEQAGPDDQLTVDLRFESMRDFQPDALVDQVPELRQLIALRDALKALKGPLGNLPDFRKRLQGLVQDEGTRQRLLAELGVQEKQGE
ncbi:MAG TPA: type VI secretion system contractile sheath small subunit [Alcaligenes sp.]|nr:type VI secretion system contractile sheath small subunit [Alcaligenes sp.]HRL27851.1 type VI secretion system contractile sheath small subunit [Alcaligenes sp.]